MGLLVCAATVCLSGHALAASKILFEDDFNGPSGTAPDASKWVDYGSWCKTPEGVTVDQPGFGYIDCYAKKYVDGKGNLVLPATPKQGSGVQTATKFGFVYGEASAWMKMPKEVGYWPAFWTLNQLNSGGQGKVTGEADIVEYYSTWDGTYHAVTHAYGFTPTATRPGGRDNYCTMGTSLTDGFHKYTARFEPGKITYSLDGKVCATEVTDTFVQWPFGPNNPTGNWLILDNAIGGAGGAQKPATQDSAVLIDRVEVKSLDDNTPAPTASPTPKPAPAASNADLNGDGRVNILDLSILLTNYGKNAARVGDLNGDGAVSILDLSLLLAHWTH